ncbi:MAG: hypothetical protein ACJ8FO_06450 [Sphingomicrobium sp.]
MSASDSRPQPSKAPKIRRDGWTPERQLRFLDALASTRSIVKAAAFAGMSRESAYRLRERKDGALFAAFWDRAVAFQQSRAEVHIDSLADGRLMRLLGTHYRRERGDFSNIGGKGARMS